MAKNEQSGPKYTANPNGSLLAPPYIQCGSCEPCSGTKDHQSQDKTIAHTHSETHEDGPNKTDQALQSRTTRDLEPKQKGYQPKKQKNAKGKGQGKGSKRATQMRNGENICMAWNGGKCTVERSSCPTGKHVCDAYTDKHKRVCAMRNHKGMECSKAVSL